MELFQHKRPGKFQFAISGILVICAALAWVYVYNLVTVITLTAAVILMITNRHRFIDPKNKAVLITGCDTGIGNHLARSLDALGCTVFAGCLFKDGDGAVSLRKNCSKKLHIVQMDVTSDEEVNAVVKKIRAHLLKNKQDLWGVVNNAGVEIPGTVELTRVKHYKMVAEVNLYGMMRVCRVFLNDLKSSKGRILNVTSVKGRAYGKAMAAYATSKWGAEGYSNCLRMEMRDYGVKVIVIEPGAFAAATQIITMENIKKHYQMLWKDADQETKDTMGVHYIEDKFKALGEVLDLSSSCSDLSYVDDDIIDGLFNENPKIRYLVNGGIKAVDKWLVAVYLTSYLPFDWMDWLTENYFKLDDTN